jgi:hypothetical protein
LDIFSNKKTSSMIGASMNKHFSPGLGDAGDLGSDSAQCRLAELSQCVPVLAGRRRAKPGPFSVRRGIAEPLAESADTGVMLTVIQGGGLGYAATADLSPGGLQLALDEAIEWAKTCALASVFPFKAPVPGSDEASTTGGWSAPEYWLTDADHG